ncbi:MAG: hypothetical protein AUG51_08885 [Acidobacteria bacterium 13_1_20CM_3_53_8]|nr:MAG: hypothetical protein AUG51_08885 [Acidobacteria bacterium 13_1_20CM_3_53_8]
MKYLITLVCGLLVGVVATLFFLGGARAHPSPGALVKPPDPGGDPPGTAIVALDDKFFDAVLGTIFRDLNAPSFPLQIGENVSDSSNGSVAFRQAAFQEQCTNQVMLLPEGSNVRTGVRFNQGKIEAPLAFNGSYNLLGNCWRFKGWAQARMDLSFDVAQQTVYGRINIESVNLEGISPIVSGIITPLIQNTLNERVNPIEVLRAQQLRLAVPVKASNGTLQAQVKDVRAEVTDNALRLHITYDFNAVRQQ